MKSGRCRRPGHGSVTFRIPTMRKQRYDIVVRSGKVVFVPEGAPRPVFERRHEVGHASLWSPAVIRRVSASGASIVTNKSPEGFTAFPKIAGDRFSRLTTEDNTRS